MDKDCNTHRRDETCLQKFNRIKRKLGRSRRRWEDNINVKDAYWINPAEDRVEWWALVNTVMNLSVHEMR
jgi:hypothetical protein